MAFCGLKMKRKDIIERDCDAGEAKSKDKQGGINEKYYLAEVIGNLESPGKCYCIVCDTEIKYSTRGLPALRDHCVKSSKLKDKIKLIKSNYRLDFYPKKRHLWGMVSMLYVFIVVLQLHVHCFVWSQNTVLVHLSSIINIKIFCWEHYIFLFLFSLKFSGRDVNNL